MRVVLLGAYPPPVGGNSVHIQRLVNLLLSAGYDCSVVDPYGCEPIVPENGVKVRRVGGRGLRTLINTVLTIRKSRPDVVHIHISAMNRFIFAGPILLLFLMRRSRIYLTVHSGSFVKNYYAYGRFKKILSGILFRSLSGIIAVNEEQKKLLVDCGCNQTKVEVVPAYLPPSVKVAKKLTKVVDDARGNKKNILVTSGYGLPLYGFEKIIKAFEEDRRLVERFKLVICLYNAYDERYICALEQGLTKIVDSVILRGLPSDEFAYILKNAGVYVRATDRDGDAVAIREAHHFGVPVVASSVVSRPDYCILFDREDAGSLQQAIWESAQRDVLIDHVAEGALDKITKLYRQ